MAAIAALRAGAAHVMCTDGDQQTLNNCQYNMEMNNISQQLYNIFQLKWGDVDSWRDVQMKMNSNNNSTICAPAPEVIFGADLLYDPSVITGLISVLKALLLVDKHDNSAATGLSHNDRDSGGCPTSQPIKRVGLLVTTLRNESTVKLFLDAIERDTSNVRLCIQQITQDELLKQHYEMKAPPATQEVRFDYIPSLEEARHRFIIHMLT
jgi:hypothetical protein